MSKFSKKSIAFIFAMVMVISVVLVGCGGGGDTPASTPAATSTGGDAPASAADEGSGEPVEKITLRWGMQFADPTLHPSGVTNLWFIDEVTKRLGEDRIEFVVYPNAQLGSTTEQILGGLLNGNAEMMDFNTGGYADYTTAYSPLEAPYLFETAEQGYALLDGPAGQIMKDKAKEEAGLHTLYFIANGYRCVSNSLRPIETLEDMKGLKIRIQNNPVYVALMDAFGAAAAPMSVSEVYTALQQKVIDGQENGVVATYELKVYEQQDYFTYTNHTYNTSSCVMSEAFYQSLPDDVREVFDEVAQLAQVESRKFEAEFEETAMNYLSESLEVTELTPENMQDFIDAGRSVWPVIAEICGEEYFNEIISYAEAGV